MSRFWTRALWEFWPSMVARAASSRFRRNVWRMARANVLAQTLPMLAAPLLTRLYGPADFGALALFASVLSVGLAVSTGRFDWSVPNARSSGMAVALLAVGGLVLVAVTTAWVLAWTTQALWLPTAWHGLDESTWLLPLALLGGGLHQLLQAWHVRSADLAALGRSRVVQSAASVGVSVLAAPLLAAGVSAWGLLLGMLVGAWVGLGMLWRKAPSLHAAMARLNTRRLAVAWQRFRAEAGWSTLASAANAASFAAVPLLLARHYSVAEVGYYALMYRLVVSPVGLLGGAVGQSFWAEAARLVHTDAAALARLYRRSSVRLGWMALPLALLALAGPWYVGVLFGKAQWADAGWVLAACVPMLVGQAVASPLSHLVIHRRQHWQAAWDLARVALLVVVIETMGRGGIGLAWTVLGLSTVMGSMYGVLILLNLMALRAARGG